MKSCWGCKYLFSVGEGYSNYTWIDNSIRCALNKNPNLPADRPYDWIHTDEGDNWPKTNNSICESYIKGPFIALDVDGDDGPADYTQDEEVIKLICASTNRGRNGGMNY